MLIFRVLQCNCSGSAAGPVCVALLQEQQSTEANSWEKQPLWPSCLNCLLLCVFTTLIGYQQNNGHKTELMIKVRNIINVFLLKIGLISKILTSFFAIYVLGRGKYEDVILL